MHANVSVSKISAAGHEVNVEPAEDVRRLYKIIGIQKSGPADSLVWQIVVYIQYRPAGVVSGNSIYSDHFPRSHASWNVPIIWHRLKREDNYRNM